MREVAAELRRRGYKVTSSWIDTDFPTASEGSSAAPPELHEKYAAISVADLVRADCCLSFTETPGTVMSRGGRAVEFGMALAWGKGLVIVGPCENIFHHLRNVKVYDDLETMLNSVFPFRGDNP